MMQLFKNIKNRSEQVGKVQQVKPVYINNTITTETKQSKVVRRFRRGMMVWVDEGGE